MLDLQLSKIGYVCGRLAAVTEASHDACNNLYGKVVIPLASTEPFSMAKQFVALPKTYHSLPKVESLVSEIVNLMPATGLPKKLTVEEQSDFFLGYYHQKEKLNKIYYCKTVAIEQINPEKVQITKQADPIDELKKDE